MTRCDMRKHLYREAGVEGDGNIDARFQDLQSKESGIWKECLSARQ